MPINEIDRTITTTIEVEFRRLPEDPWECWWRSSTDSTDRDNDLELARKIQGSLVRGATDRLGAKEALARTRIVVVITETTKEVL